jgi:hypothetical protein
MVDLSPLVDGLKKNRLVFRVLAAVQAALLIGICLLPVHDEDERWIKVGTVTMFGLMAAGTGVAGLLDPEKSRVIRTLRETPGDVAWLYPVHRMSYGSHVATVLYFCLRNGKRLMCPVVPKEEAATVVENLRRLCPNAEVGFTPEAERRWRAGSRAPTHPRVQG